MNLTSPLSSPDVVAVVVSSAGKVEAGHLEADNIVIPNPRFPGRFRRAAVASPGGDPRECARDVHQVKAGRGGLRMDTANISHDRVLVDPDPGDTRFSDTAVMFAARSVQSVSSSVPPGRHAVRRGSRLLRGDRQGRLLLTDLRARQKAASE